MWSRFDEILAESEGVSERHDSENSMEIMVEMYLSKEPLLSHLEHIHPFDLLEREEATVALFG